MQKAPSHLQLIHYLTVVNRISWFLNGSEVGGDLVWGENLTLKLANYALMHLNGSEISTTTESLPTSFPLKG